MRLLANCLAIRLRINFILIHSNQQAFPFSKIQPEGMSAANSLVERFQSGILSEDISAETKC